VTSSLEDARFLFDALTHSEKASPDYLNVADLDPSSLCPETARKSYRILSAVEAASEMALYDGIRFGASADEWESVEARVSKTRGSFFSYDEKKVLLLGTALLMDGRREACYLPAREYRETVRKTFEGILERADVIRIPFSEESAFLPGYLVCSALASGGMLLMTSAERSHMLFAAADADGREEGSARA
jgi:Asp-tRNA(Asn)/Glu-tRNA(Gln) amidotransferase A subunit family amidase